jgi:hypothetical protein
LVINSFRTIDKIKMNVMCHLYVGSMYKIYAEHILIGVKIKYEMSVSRMSDVKDEDANFI